MISLTPCPGPAHLSTDARKREGKGEAVLVFTDESYIHEQHAKGMVFQPPLYRCILSYNINEIILVKNT